MKLVPLLDCIKNAREWQAEGFTTYQQFLCSRCGAKNTVEEPNKWFTHGRCGDCNHITDLQKNGCNCMAQSGPLDRRGLKGAAFDK